MAEETPSLKHRTSHQDVLKKVALERKKNSQKLRVQAGIYRMIASIKLTFSFKVRL